MQTGLEVVAKPHLRLPLQLDHANPHTGFAFDSSNQGAVQPHIVCGF